MTTETNPQPDTEGLSAEDIQQLAQQGYATRARDKILSAIYRGVIPDIRQFSEDERQTFWTFFPLSKQTDGTLPSADEVFGDEQLQAACQNALASRKQVIPIPISAYEYAKHHTFNKLQSENETRNVQLGMWDAYVESGKLPSPKQLEPNPMLHGLWAEAFETLEETFHLDDAAKAWKEAQRRYNQYLIEQSKKAMGTSTETTISKSNADTTKPREQRGMKAGTANRVREMHRLLKSGLSQRQAKRKSRCDPSTYYRWCLEATSEEPIEPYQ